MRIAYIVHIFFIFVVVIHAGFKEIKHCLSDMSLWFDLYTNKSYSLRQYSNVSWYVKGVLKNNPKIFLNKNYYEKEKITSIC